ncbi:MAG: cation diffusion facilitator family transporter [Eubacterium sp.]|jgi:cobalt-zinc-cadmium efflux system protein|nr:cation diffusion facilitator family transporter [Eubacterium sp.]
MKDINVPKTNSMMVKNQKKLLYTIILVSIILAAKFYGAFITNSLALFSDSWHLITDLAALILSWWGVRTACKSATHKYTFGYYRYSVLTALINNISLIIISIFILYKAVVRYMNPVDIAPEGMVVFSVLGLIVNLIIVRNLGSKSNNANVKSVFLHFAGDALSDLGVLLGGIVIIFTKWRGIDTLLSAILACLILKSAIKMTVECTKILLEATPKGISIDKLKQALVKIPGIIDIKDIHVWSLSMEMLSMTAHISINEAYWENHEILLHKVQHLIKDEFGIGHSTIQIEHLPCSSCYHNKPEHMEVCTMCVDCYDYFKVQSK